MTTTTTTATTTATATTSCNYRDNVEDLRGPRRFRILVVQSRIGKEVRVWFCPVRTLSSLPISVSSALSVVKKHFKELSN